MDVGCRELDNTVWSSKLTDSDQQRSVVLFFFFPFFKKIYSYGLRDQLLRFYSSFIVVKYLFLVGEAVEVNEISQRAVFAEKHSK